jgi:hypothetical protein
MTTNNPEIERLLPLRKRAERDWLRAGRADEENDALAERLDDIEDAILAEPARTLADIRTKAEILWRGGDHPSREKALALLREIALLDGQPSRAFDPEAWLEWFEQLDGCYVERDDQIILLAPVGGRADNALAALEACNAQDQVRAFVRERIAAREHA